MSTSPKILTAQIRLLERLCNVSAIAGQESAVRKIVKKTIKDHVDDLKVDPLGNVLAVKRGKGRGRMKVLLAAHMDEVGFMIVNDEKDGLYRFANVGGIDPRQLPGKAIVAGKKQTPGVIGLTPIHLTSASERKNTAKTDSLRIDLGPKGTKVKPGDFATFAPNFMVIGRGASRSIRSKALDDRVGVATLIELLKNSPDNIDLIAAFTVQEEIGLRGANVVAFDTAPDVAIALDTTPAYDLPAWEEDDENTRYNSKLGEGPALYTSDRVTLSDPRLIGHFAGVGDAEGIRYQYRQPGGGGTDAGAIHKTGAGIPALSISTPARYLHTAAGLIRLSDWQDTLALVHAGLSGLKPAIFNSER